MAVAFGSASTATTGTNTQANTLTITPPTGLADGDIMVCGICYNTNGFFTVIPPAGWTTITAGGSGTDTSFDMAVFWKKAASESGNYVFTLSNSTSQNMSGGIARYTGADGTNPINVSSSPQHGTSSSVTSPSVTTTVDGCMIVGIYAGWSTPSATPPTGMTERIDIGQADAGLTIDLEVADETQSTHGATGTFTATMSGATHCWGETLAIAPAAGGGTSISASSAIETWAGQGSSLNVQTNVAASAGLETWSGKAATVAANTNVSASSALETWSGKAATVLISGPTTITANSALETWSGQAASVQIGGVTAVLKNRVFRSKKHVIYGG